MLTERSPEVSAKGDGELQSGVCHFWIDRCSHPRIVSENNESGEVPDKSKANEKIKSDEFLRNLGEKSTVREALPNCSVLILAR
jgi:hypothetical protein